MGILIRVNRGMVMNLKFLKLLYGKHLGLIGLVACCVNIYSQPVHAQRSANLFSMCNSSGWG